MSALARYCTQQVQRTPSTLEEKLEWMRRFGKPSVYACDVGWSVSIEMHVASAGTTFKVRSEFNIPTITAATDQCIERMLNTITQYSK
jgi:hypothetical protein